MLQQYLRDHSEFLEEDEFRVKLKNDIDHFANTRYSDSDFYSPRWMDRYWSRIFRDKLAIAGVRMGPNSRVLDVCCGQGYLGEQIEALYGSKITFCDLSEAQIAALQGRLNARRESPVDARTANLMNLPFPCETFDLVVGNSFLHHLSDVRAGLAELSRVAKRGSKLIFCHEPSLTAIFWESFPLSLVRDTSPDERSGFTDLWLFQPGDLIRLANSAGLKNARVVGSGLLSSLLINWYVLLAHKAKLTSTWSAYPAYRIKACLTKIDLTLQTDWKLRNSPSLMLIADKI